MLNEHLKIKREYMLYIEKKKKDYLSDSPSSYINS